jgi:hypothetical protein
MTQHSFEFEYELERDDETLYVEVTYATDGDEVWLESVQYDGGELNTTAEEDARLLAQAKDNVSEDLIDAAASYGDYLYDLRRDQED